MDINSATQQYEEWIRHYTSLVEEDLERKHQVMASAPFPFMRGTFYRWVQRWPKVCSNLTDAPMVLAVGDLHIENFGTWRDREGRLVWGINDFDEAAYLPYTMDLVRLATSAYLAIAEKNISLDRAHASDAILTGYRDGLEAHGKPYVLAEHHVWLRNIARACLKDPVAFWHKMDELPGVDASVIPVSARVVIEDALAVSKKEGQTIQYKRRTAGVGSLGHPRFVAVTDQEGGRVTREAKALTPSAVAWASTGTGPVEIYYDAMLSRTVRCRDPYVDLHGHWLLRRLAPDCSRIELTALNNIEDETRLLQAMGWETANIHISERSPILNDLKKRKTSWLDRAAEAMVSDVNIDWGEWSKVYSSREPIGSH